MVDLTSLPDGIYGAIWDGGEFYSIAPAHALAAFMGDIAPPTSDQALIYRASDVDVLVGPGFCAAVDRRAPSDKSVSGLDQYKALLSELPHAASTADAIATLELEVAMIGDFEFFSEEADPLGELLYRLNIVDGIFSEQVGVVIAASELKVFDQSADPFTTSDARTLLDQVGSYRVATPVIAATGLAHLVTGRELNGSTVGIAYIAGVCETEFGVSLSERFTDPFFSALIAAHEFGHNFGAPHDGEPGSPCQATGFNFLMSPELNSSSTFSQCSRNQMAPVIAASSCIRTRKYVDLAVEIPQTVYSGHTRAPETIAFDVVNTGTQTAAGAIARIDLYASLTPASITAEGGSCTASLEDMTCHFDSIPVGGRRRIQFDVTAMGIGEYPNAASVEIDADVDQSNNHGLFTFAVDATTAASLEAESPLNRTLLSGTEFQLSYRVSVAGIEPLAQATGRTTASGFVILAATAESGSCVVSQPFVTCNLGGIPVGESRRVTLRLRASSAGQLSIRHTLEASIDDTTGDNRATHVVNVQPLVDLVLQADAASILVQTGEVFTRRFTVLSLGPREARQSSFRVNWSERLEVAAISAQDGACALEPTAATYRCVFGSPIESGGSRQVDVTFRAVSTGGSSIHASVFSPDNQHVSGPYSTSVHVTVEARESADVRIEMSSDRIGFDLKPFDIGWAMTSVGFTPATSANLTLSLPAGMKALSATTSDGSCELATTSVQCNFGEIERDRRVQVMFRVEAEEPGIYVLSADAAATNDGDPTNNQDSVTLDIAPNVDVFVDVPPPVERVRVGQIFTYPVEIRTASHPVPNVEAHVEGWKLDIESISIEQGSCTTGVAGIDCALGALPARSSVRMELEVRAVEAGSAQISVQARGEGDVDTSNDSNGELLAVVPQGNARIEIDPPSGRPKAGESFQSPEIRVTALSATDAVRVRITVPPEISIESVAQHAGPCSIVNRIVDCDFGDLQYADMRSTFMHLRAAQAGSFTIAAEAVPLDDSDTSDNTASVTVNVDAASPPAAPPPSSGGGGGGSLDWPTLLFGALGLGLRRRRRRPAVVVHARQVHSGRCPDGSAH